MKDVKYFIDKEREYNKIHEGENNLLFDDESEEECYPDTFLERGIFTDINQNYLTACKSIIKNNGYVLEDVEVLILIAFVGRASQYFKDEYFNRYEDVPEVAKEMQIVLDSLLKKAPKHNSDILYRFLKSDDNNSLHVGDIFEPKHSLTTTTENWDQDRDVYIITSLLNNKTKARDLYQVYDHGKEKQVNFLKGAKFKVLKVEPRDQQYKNIHLAEVE